MKLHPHTTAVITGAAGGIGQAIARRLQEAGCHLALVDVHAERLAAVAAALPASSLRVTQHLADVSELADHERVQREVLDAHTGPFLIVLNAGVTTHGAFEDQAPGDLSWVVGVDLMGVMWGARVWWPVLLAEGRGHLVATSSMAAMTGIPLQASYATAKAGVRALLQSLRVEAAGTGVGVTCVLPGTIATDFLTHARSRHGSTDLLARWMPRVGASPDRVAKAVTRAVRCNRGEVTVGVDAFVVERLSRWTPWLLPTLLRLGWRVMRARRREEAP